jgi:hypothetical protein
MNWLKKAMKDSGGFWTDHISDNGQFIIAQGYDEWERTQGKPWGLFDCSNKDLWKILSYFSTADDAKAYAEILLEVSQTSIAVSAMEIA